MESGVSLRGILNISGDEKGVKLGVNIFHHDLEAVETAGFGYLDFGREVLYKIFIDDGVRTGEEGEDECEEAAFVRIQLVVPCRDVVCEIDFFNSPEARLCSLVHVPYLPLG